jgi:hypothetical protein
MGFNIRLDGIKKGDSINLSEKDPTGKISGKFNCHYEINTISGKWISNDGKRTLEVKVQKKDSTLFERDRQIALDSFDLRLFKTEFPDSILSEHDTRSLHYTFKNRNLRSLRMEGCSTGAYTTFNTIVKTYNTATGSQINIWDELDKERSIQFKAVLTKLAQKQLTACRKQISDTEWISALSSCHYSNFEGDEKGLNRLFTIKNVSEVMNVFYVDSNGVNFECPSYFGLPHVLQGLDFHGHVIINFHELEKYLKPNSILCNKVH